MDLLVQQAHALGIYAAPVGVHAVDIRDTSPLGR